MNFPRTEKYQKNWILQNSLGGNSLMGIEALTEAIPLLPTMRVLDLACGTGITSIFLHKEFGVQVWAVDNGGDLEKMYALFQTQEVDKHVFPMNVDARNLPFAHGFFDVVFCVNAYTYFGTDDKYLPYIAQFIKPTGYIGVCDICVAEEIQTIEDVPDFLKTNFSSYWYHIHEPTWWREKWAKTQLFGIEKAEILPTSALLKQAYLDFAEANQAYDAFAEAIQQDTAGKVQYMRLIAQRNQQQAFLETYQQHMPNKKI